MLRFRRISFSRLPLELIIWVSGLMYLAALGSASPALDLCLVKKIGLPFCPGCGLGRSVSYFLQGELRRSLQTHPLGLPAFLILSARIITLSYKLFNRNRAPKPRTLP